MKTWCGCWGKGGGSDTVASEKKDKDTVGVGGL